MEKGLLEHFGKIWEPSGALGRGFQSWEPRERLVGRTHFVALYSRCWSQTAELFIPTTNELGTSYPPPSTFERGLITVPLQGVVGSR